LDKQDSVLLMDEKFAYDLGELYAIISLYWLQLFDDIFWSCVRGHCRPSVRWIIRLATRSTEDL